jgi:hypothetical protein
MGGQIAFPLVRVEIVPVYVRGIEGAVIGFPARRVQGDMLEPVPDAARPGSHANPGRIGQLPPGVVGFGIAHEFLVAGIGGMRAAQEPGAIPSAASSRGLPAARAADKAVRTAPFSCSPLRSRRGSNPALAIVK